MEKMKCQGHQMHTVEHELRDVKCCFQGNHNLIRKCSHVSHKSNMPENGADKFDQSRQKDAITR